MCTRWGLNPRNWYRHEHNLPSHLYFFWHCHSCCLINCRRRQYSSWGSTPLVRWNSRLCDSRVFLLSVKPQWLRETTVQRTILTNNGAREYHRSREIKYFVRRKSGQDRRRSEQIREVRTKASRFVVAARALRTMDQPQESSSNPPWTIRLGERSGQDSVAKIWTWQRPDIPEPWAKLQKTLCRLSRPGSLGVSALLVVVLVPGTWYPHIDRIRGNFALVVAPGALVWASIGVSRKCRTRRLSSFRAYFGSFIFIFKAVFWGTEPIMSRFWGERLYLWSKHISHNYFFQLVVLRLA